MPEWVRKLFLYYIPKILLMERPDHEERWKKKEITPPPSYQNTPETRRVPLNMTSDLLELTEIHHPHCKLNPPLDRGNGIDDGEEAFRMTPDLYKATEAVRFIYKHLKTEEDYETVRMGYTFEVLSLIYNIAINIIVLLKIPTVAILSSLYQLGMMVLVTQAFTHTNTHIYTHVNL